MVAEDDEDLRSVLERGLRENGYAVDVTGDGEKALRYLDTFKYEVAILDWRMPKFSGLEVTELAILETLVKRSPAVVSRRAIALAVWDDEADTLGSNTLDVHLARLRAKIGISGAKVEAVRALGYRIVAP